MKCTFLACAFHISGSDLVVICYRGLVLLWGEILRFAQDDSASLRMTVSFSLASEVWRTSFQWGKPRLAQKFSLRRFATPREISDSASFIPLGLGGARPRSISERFSRHLVPTGIEPVFSP